MKLLLISLIILVNAYGFSQGNLNPLSKWYVNELPFAINKGVIYNYYITSDTIINNTKYYKIYSDEYTYYNETNSYKPCIYDMYLKKYVGAIREISKSYFFIRKNETTEFLYYKFNVSKGDTIKGIIKVLASDTLVYDKIKRYTLTLIGVGSDVRKDIWVEGIGSIKSGFLHPIGYIPTDPTYEFIKFFDGYNGRDTSFAINKDCITNIGEELVSTNTILFPNPSNGKILSLKTTIKIKDVIIFDSQGKYMKTIRVKKDEDIELLGFNTGLYLFILTDFSGTIISQNKIQIEP